MPRTGDRDPVTLDTLAAARAETGDFEAAVETLERGIARAASSGNTAGAQRLRSRLPACRNRTPHRDINLNE